MSAPGPSQVVQDGVQTAPPATGNTSSSSATPVSSSNPGASSVIATNNAVASTNNASNNNNAVPSTQGAGASSAQEDLICRWNTCNERFASAEVLYEHICERHVGRKSTNNLNLTCQWNSCRTTTVKRDHITSHIRVHVPLKPHKCDFCGKSFKRPQDLKKHVKTHADDSVLVVPNSDRLGQAPRGGMPGPTPSSYYDHTGAMRTNQPMAQPHQGAQANNYYPQQTTAYTTPMYYPTTTTHPRTDIYAGGAGTTAATNFENRKRGFEAVSDFFQSVKRREIDPRSYSQVDRSLVPLHNSLPIHTGSVANEYMTAATVAAPLPAISTGPLVSGGVATATSSNALAQRYYLPNSSDIRTKNDLIQVDRFLEQMQGTIYESDPSTTPPSTLAQPGSHYAPTQVHIKSSQSPPQMHAHPHAMPPAYPQASAAHMASPLSAISSAHSTGTPAVTPPSSSMSYTSGHSPGASSAGFSPASRHSSTASVMYPALSMAPSGSNITPTLGTNFDADRSRRHSGGLLQKASRGLAPLSVVQMDPPVSKKKEAENVVSSPSLSDTSGDAHHEAWLENIRLIEYLRQTIQHKLTVGDYDKDGAEEESQTAKAKQDSSLIVESSTCHRSTTPAESDASEPLYPLLKPLAL